VTSPTSIGLASSLVIGLLPEWRVIQQRFALSTFGFLPALLSDPPNVPVSAVLHTFYQALGSGSQSGFQTFETCVEHFLAPANPIQRRTVPKAANSIPAGWIRRSSEPSGVLELIRGPGKLGDPVSHLGSGLLGELRDLIRPCRCVEVYPRHRHQRPRDPQESPLQIHLKRPYLVPPPPPQQWRQHEDQYNGYNQCYQHRQNRKIVWRVCLPCEHVTPEYATREDRDRLQGSRKAPQQLRPRVEPLLRFGLQRSLELSSCQGNHATRLEVLRDELAASGVYVLAPAGSQGRREAELPRVL
jgi:hypothetical protein